MPTYEYRCNECGHEFEAFQMMTEPPVKKCPVCSGKVIRKISGGAGFLFKGSGFYITDYRSREYKKAADAEKGKASDTKAASASDKPKTSSSGPGKASD